MYILSISNLSTDLPLVYILSNLALRLLGRACLQPSCSWHSDLVLHKASTFYNLTNWQEAPSGLTRFLQLLKIEFLTSYLRTFWWPTFLRKLKWRIFIYFVKFLIKLYLLGMLTWPIQDDRMNMTKNFEHDQKIHTDEH